MARSARAGSKKSRGAAPKGAVVRDIRSARRASPAVKRILVIDDHVDARVVLEEFFGAHGFEVSVAKDGREALALITGGLKYDLVILDLMMPRVDGFAFLERLREQHLASATLPIVVVSAIAPPEVRGAAASFRKPAPLTELLQTVERLIGPAASPRR